MSAPPSRRAPSSSEVVSSPTASPTEEARAAARLPTYEKRPFLLDFFPLETERETRLARFFERLREGRLSTTQCTQDRTLLWPPRTACPKCHGEDLVWVDLPESGRIYAFSAVLGGAPLGMEDQVPFVVGLVDLDGTPLRLFGRIEGRPWNELVVGQAVRVESFDIGDGRYFYRFRATG